MAFSPRNIVGCLLDLAYKDLAWLTKGGLTDTPGPPSLRTWLGKKQIKKTLESYEIILCLKFISTYAIVRQYFCGD